jgi:hypothetical protein
MYVRDHPYITSGHLGTRTHPSPSNQKTGFKIWIDFFEELSKTDEKSSSQ